MASKHSIAIAKVQKDFSHYFKVETKSNYIFIHNESFNDEDDLLGINAEIQMINPLNGSNGGKSLNIDCPSTTVIVDYCNKSADATEGVDTVKLINEERIDLVYDGHEKMTESTDIVNLTLQYDANGTEQNTGLADHHVGGNIPQVGNGQQGRINEQHVGDNERKARSINEDLNQCIALYEQKRNEASTIDVDFGLNPIIDGLIFRGSDEIDVPNPSTSSKVVDRKTQSQNQQQSFMSFGFDFDNNLTSNQYRIMNEVFSDASTTCVLLSSTSDNLNNLVTANIPQAVSFSTSLYKLMRVVKPCYVLLKDCLVEHPQKSMFDNNQDKAEVIKTKAASSTLPSEIPKMITNLTRPVFEMTTLPMVNQPLTMERNNVLINDWLRESSQVTPDRYMDMDINELLQDANHFISSEIGDDAFQLAKYMESNDRTINYNQTSDSINPTSSNVPQHLNEINSVNYSEPPWNAALKSGNSFGQPLDLSIKQTTSISTDTGFGYNSSQIDVSSSYRSLNEVSRGHSKVVVDNSDMNNTDHGEIINNFTSNICTKTSHDNKIEKEQNKNFAENYLKQRDPQAEKLPSTCEQKQATATYTGRKRNSSSAKTTLPKTNKRHTSEEKPAISSKEVTSKKKRPSSTDLTKESDAHSTDLDFEPYDHAGDEKVKGEQKEIFATGTVPSNNSKMWEKVVIKIPNNKDSSSRVVVVGESSSSPNLSQMKVNTKVVSTPVSIVEPLTTKQASIARAQFFGNYDTLKREMRRVFNWPCFNHLNGKDCGDVCRFNHDLPPPRDIFGKAMIFSNDTIMYMYNFIAKSSITFDFYFDIICEVFGSRKMETSLINAIRDCEKLEKISFFKCIYQGLVMTGLSKRDALTKIAECCRKTRSSCDVIIEIMIEADALYFIEMLKQYYWHGTINSTYMLKLLHQVLDNPAPSLITVFVDILDKYSNSEVCDVDTFKLIIRKAAFLVIEDLNLTRRWNIIKSRIK